MSSITFAPFTPLLMPTHTTLLLIDSTAVPALLASLASAYSLLLWQTDEDSLAILSMDIRGAQASISIIDAIQLLATATDDSVKAEATQAIFNATVDLKELKAYQDAPKNRFNPGANALFLFLMGTVLLFTVGMFLISRYTWFNVAWFFAYAIETIGYVSRIVLHYYDDPNNNIYTLQYVAITVGPIFITAVFYFFFAQMAVLYGRKYSLLEPMVYSYIFILCDVGALLVQVTGGVLSSSSTQLAANTGRWIMVGGIAFQVLAMAVYLVLWFVFLWKVYFDNLLPVESPVVYRKSLSSFFRLLLNGRRAQEYKKVHLEPFFTPLMAHARRHTLFHWFPLAVTVASLVIFTRCIYRVVELSQGWDGYLVRHEAFLMVFESLLVAFCGWIFIPFHPVFVFGRTRLKVKDIKKKRDVEKGLNQEEGFELAQLSSTNLLLRVEETTFSPLIPSSY